MKISRVIILSFFLFTALSVIVSCNNSSDKKKDNETSTEKNNDSTSKKDIPTSSSKGDSKKWNADASAAQIKFNVKGPFGKVDGSLSGLKATILFDEDKLSSSSFHASVDSKSISTGIKLRNNDLQKEKYLNSDSYPSMSFQSKRIEKSGKSYKAIGELTIKGVTREVEIPFDFTEKGNGGVFKGEFTIQREDYKIGPSGGLIGKTITINLEVPVTK